MKHVPGYLQLLTENGSQKRPLKNSSLFMRLGSVSGDRKKKNRKRQKVGKEGKNTEESDSDGNRSCREHLRALSVAEKRSEKYQ